MSAEVIVQNVTVGFRVSFQTLDHKFTPVRIG